MGFQNQSFRLERTYDDYTSFMKIKLEVIVTEMDTLEGVRKKGKRLLTMILRKNSVMLLLLMPGGTCESV